MKIYLVWLSDLSLLVVVELYLNQEKINSSFFFFLLLHHKFSDYLMIKYAS